MIHDGTNATFGPVVTVRQELQAKHGAGATPLYRVRLAHNKDSTRDEHEFSFDRAFGPDSTQEEVYRESVAPQVRRAIEEGRSCSVMAYGATGSGKTFTMLGGGAGADEGLVTRSTLP